MSKVRRLANMICQAKGFNYGFVEYDDPGAAERAMQTLNGRRVHQSVCPQSEFQAKTTGRLESLTNEYRK